MCTLLTYKQVKKIGEDAKVAVRNVRREGNELLKKAGSNNIAMRFNSTTMKLLNGTGIEVNGAGQFDSTVDIDDDLTIGTDKFFVDVLLSIINVV